MLRRAIVSPLNPIQFVPAGVEKAARYNTYVPYYSWLKEQLRPWETEVDYMQKIQGTDPLNLQIKFNFRFLSPIPQAKLRLYACSGGEAIDEYDFEDIPDYPIHTEDGLVMIGQQLNDNQFFATMLEANGPGQYYFVIEFPFNTTGGGSADTFDYWISERFHLAESWPDTVLLEYSNDTNSTDVIFEQIRQRFAFRVEAALILPKDLVNRVTFQDQDAKTVPLSADPYTGYTLAFGGNGNFLPDWVFKKLNWIFTMDNIQSDGFPITAADGAAIQRDYIQDYPLFSGKIDVVEAKPQKDYRFNRGQLLIFTAPISVFVIMNLQIGYGGINIYDDFTAQVIQNSSELNAYIVALNSALSTAGLSGSVTRVGQEVFYNLGPNEDFSSATALILGKQFGIRNNLPGAGPVTMALSLSGFEGNNAPYLILNPDSTINTSGYLGDSLQTFNLNATGVLGNNYYAIFHNDTISEIWISGDYVSSFLGATAFPQQLRQFVMQNADLIDVFNMDMLSESKEYLESLLISECPVLEDFGGYAASMGVPWYKLKNIFVRECILTVGAVDALLDEFETRIQAGEQVVFNGLLKLEGQTPAAPPTPGPSTATIATLENIYNWTVTTD